MVKVYPVIKTQDVCEDYEVYVNGTKAELNTARVSAYPFNRRWPGHQRQTEQTELVNFLSMESDEEVELKIIPKRSAYTFRLRPRDLDARAKIDANGIITVRIKGAAQFTVEPYGRNHALHVFIDPVSSYNVDKNASDVLYFGAGEHDVGDLYLQSGQTLFIDEGAVVYATVYVMHAENVKIIGRGILDNSKNKEIVLYETNAVENEAAVDNAKRAHALNFVCCKDVEVDGITIRESLLYNMQFASCANAHVNNVKIIGCWRFNTDGVHFSNCTACSLTNSFLRTYDDSICVRGYANYDYDRYFEQEKEENLSFICNDVLIKNCVVWNDWGKNLQVGTETFSDAIYNIRFEDCKLIHTTGMAVTMWLVDNAKITDVIFENITVEYDDYILKNSIQNSDADVYEDSYDPNFGGCLVSFAVNKHFEYSLIKSEAELGYIHGVTVRNLRLYAVQKPYFSFSGDNVNSTCEDITLENVYWNDEPISKELFEKQTHRNEFVKNIKWIQNRKSR